MPVMTATWFLGINVKQNIHIWFFMRHSKTKQKQQIEETRKLYLNLFSTLVSAT